ncbi:MAG TPA: hypothetical protein P5136_02690 [Methanofastidiosum sp.]|nr:hypothetical protein [Methanofastidiosum sp.]
MALDENKMKIIKWVVIGVSILLGIVALIVAGALLLPKGITDVIVKPIVSIGKILNIGAPDSEDLQEALDIVKKTYERVFK